MNIAIQAALEQARKEMAEPFSRETEIAAMQREAILLTAEQLERIADALHGSFIATADQLGRWYISIDE
jgi:hypothetical protein